MNCEPWLEDLSEDWGDEPDDAPWSKKLHDVGLALDSLRASRWHENENDIELHVHRHSSSAPSQKAHSLTKWAAPRLRNWGLTVDDCCSSKHRLDQVNTNRRRTIDASKMIEKNGGKEENREEELFIHDDYDLDEIWDEGGSVLQHEPDVPDDYGTTQIKVRRTPTIYDMETMPEWKKRLMKGEKINDLFIQKSSIESLFDAPPGHEVDAQDEDPGLSIGLASMRLNEPTQPAHNTHCQVDAGTAVQVDGGEEGGSADNKQSKEQSNTATEVTTHGEAADQADSYDSRMLTASGMEEIRNEAITPIRFNVDGATGTTLMREDMRDHLSGAERRSTTDDAIERAGPVDGFDAFEITSHSLPADLSMGTPELCIATSRTIFEENDPSKNTEKPKSKLRTWTRPITPNSPRLEPSISASSIVSNPKTRSSPDTSSPRQTRSDSPQYNRGTSPAGLQSKCEEIIRPQGRLSQEVLRPESMPLRLFGNHDTFTNNKLLRRLTQLDLDSDMGCNTQDSPSDASVKQLANIHQGRSRGHRRGQSAPDFIRLVQGNRSRPSSRQSQISDETERRHARSRTAGPNLTPPPPSPPTPLNRPDYMHVRSKTAMSDRSKPINLNAAAKATNKDIKAIIMGSPYRSPDSSPSRSPTPIPRKQKSARPLTPLTEPRSPESKRLLYSPAKTSTPKRRRTSTKAPCGMLGESPIINATPFKSKSGSPQKASRSGMPNPSTRGKKIKCQVPTPLCRELSDDSSPSGDSRADGGDLTDQFEVLKRRYGGKFHDRFNRFGDSRKGSITTGDFLQEATKVMDFIRSKGKVPGTPGLASVLENDQDDDEEASDRPEGEPLEQVEEASEEGENLPSLEVSLRPPIRNSGSKAVRLRGLSKLEVPISDQRVLSHLRKFADDSEAEQLDLSPSVSSLHLASAPQRREMDADHKESGASQKSAGERRKRLSETRMAQVKREGSNGSIIASPTDIRIRERSRNQMEEALPSRSQKSSISQVPGMSGRSQVVSAGARGLIPGDKVSHLIPNSVGSMVLDQGKRQWIRDQSRPNSRQQEKLDDEQHFESAKLRSEDALNGRDHDDLHGFAANLDCSRLSEDDPFRDISDLSVDEAEELNMIQKVFDSRPGNFDPEAVRRTVDGNCLQDGDADDDTLHPTQELNATSRTSACVNDSGLGINFGAVHNSAPPLQSPSACPEPREPSWCSDLTGTTRRSDGRTPSYVSGASGSRCATNNSSSSSSQSRSDRSSQATTAVNSAHESERESGNKLDHNGAPFAHSKSSYPNKQARVVTITVPSPSRANNYGNRNGATYPKGEMTQGQDNLTDERGRPLKAKLRKNGNEKRCNNENECPTPISEKSERIVADKNPISHPPSFERRDFKGRPISRIEEERSAEESMLLQGNELSVIPMGAACRDVGAQESQSTAPTPEKSYSFHLNTLPEFTLHQVDEQDTELGTVRREVSFIGRRAQPSSLRQMHGKLSLASEQLIRSITDVQENEVYWDRIRQLDLAGKQIIGTHELEKMCPRLEELDLSRNQLTQTIGIPPSVRMLGLRHNYLNDLTAWGHLKNLQYLDVSNNELESLDVFAGMVHLRSLKASNNRITRLGDIIKLDGLLALHLRGNELLEVDFNGSTWTRMTALDLRENHIQRVRHIDCLTSLEKLDISNNDLSTFGDGVPLSRLRTLKISHNMLTHLDTTGFPELRLLYADGNNLQTICGLGHCHRMESLSLREQVPIEADDQSPLTIDVDVSCVAGLRKLHLSGNRLGKHVLRPRKPVPGLQLLDVSCCGLELLPSDLGQKFPSLRALNLNFNALSDLSGLMGITRLIRFLAAGNRISGLRNICQILKEIGGRHGSLRCVDLRGNPMTVGFYPAATMAATDPKSLTLHRKPSAFEPNANGTDESRVKDPYALPLMDPATDDRYVRRLDDGTRTRRRVVHCLINVSAGSRLKLLDGLDVSGVDPIGLLEDAKEKRGGGEDDVWRRLIELGVVRKKRSADSAVSGVMTDATGSTETIATGSYDVSGSELGGRRSRQRVR
ncbi:hypothetical protein KEM54_006314 [Ascosphaera aggregata]|nr:hypothetical protein KEM54_006314 [Ascosphaera aggregata]